MRWLSPPDSVPEARASVRYSRPDIDAGRSGGRGSPSGCGRRSRSASSVELRRQVAEPADARRAPRAPSTSPMSEPAIFTASASGFRRLPPQASQGVSLMKRRDLLARPVALGLLVAALQVGDRRPRTASSPRRRACRRHRRSGSPRSPEPYRIDVARLLAAGRPRASSSRSLVVLGERLERLAVIGRGRLAPRARWRRASGVSVSSGTTSVGSIAHLVADAAAGRAGAEGIVEREQPRLDLGDGEARDRAGEFATRR